jgi:hypothetical protein
MPVRAASLRKILWRTPAAGISKVLMISDIALGLVFTLVFFGLGAVAFTYLSKGKN